jgi:trimethylamine:corrinoid methyltransferase-like protein
LFNRKNFDGWAAEGKPTLRDRAQEKLEMILAEHEPLPLPEDMAEGVQGVINRAVRDG